MRLLLAEDEKILSEALVTMLTRSHYSVDAVYDGEDALDYLLNGEYDGAILDIMMDRRWSLRRILRLYAEDRSSSSEGPASGEGPAH